MKKSVALLFIFFVVAIRGFLNIPNENDLEHDIFASSLAVEDDNGNLIPLDPAAEDTEDVEEIRKDLAECVIFYLHTVKNPALLDAQQLRVNDVETLSQSYFNSSIPTRIVIHGWRSFAASRSCVLIRKAYLEHGEYNVIVVDWGKIANQLYIYARNRVKIVGEYVGQMIDFLAAQGVDTTEIIIVGHSLGAHVAGIAARHAKSIVGYVMALDPAQPLFAFAGPGERVAQGDAEYVQVIHTNAGVLGYKDAIGDVDFYPNGGTVQAGCALDLTGACSHIRAFRFFAESINSDRGFVGTECKNYTRYSWGSCRDNNVDIMGGSEPTVEATGSYYLRTNAVSPFAQGS